MNPVRWRRDRISRSKPSASGRPHVVLVAHDIQSHGGMDQVSTELIRRTCKEIDFTVVSISLSESLRGSVRWHQVSVISRPAPLKFLLFFIKAGFHIARIPADLVHAMGAIVPNRADLIWVQHCWAGVRENSGGLAPPGTPFPRRLNTAFAVALSLIAERWSYRPGRTGLLAASSKKIADELNRYYPGVPVAVAPDGVDSQRFAPDPLVRHRVRLDERVADDEVIVLFVGGDWHRKGLATAIEAVAVAQRQIEQRLTLWVVGRGDQRRFRSLSIRLGIGANVRFYGQPSSVERYYQAADIFVLPSLYEGFSLVAFEAAACALPVVGTREGCIEELVGDNEAGVLVEGIPATVGAALADLAGDPGRRKSLGRAARERAKSYPWDRSAATVLDLYRQLLRARDANEATDVRFEARS